MTIGNDDPFIEAQQIASEQGWSAETFGGLALDFIATLGQREAFAAYCRDVQARENETVDDFRVPAAEPSEPVMALRFRSIDTPAHEIEELLGRMFDGTCRVIAVEIFDAPNSGTTIGPWVLGPEVEVYRWLGYRSFEDYEVQYELGLHEEER